MVKLAHDGGLMEGHTQNTPESYAVGYSLYQDIHTSEKFVCVNITFDVLVKYNGILHDQYDLTPESARSLRDDLSRILSRIDARL